MDKAWTPGANPWLARTPEITVTMAMTPPITMEGDALYSDALYSEALYSEALYGVARRTVAHCKHHVLGTLLCTTMLLLAGCSEGVAPAAGEPEALITDPVIPDFPVAYVQRSQVAEESSEQTLRRDPLTMNVFAPGAALLIKASADPSATQTRVALPAEGDWDIRDLEPSPDGQQLLLSLRGPWIEDADLADQPSWNIWRLDVASLTLSRVIESDTIAEAGNDRDPAWLADGGIVFTSDRQRNARAVLLDEGRPQFAALNEARAEPAFVLHTMTADGTDITQISYNLNHDQDPVLLDDGRLLYSRTDRDGGRDIVSLFTMNPDGSDTQRLFGYASQGDEALVITDAREVSPGQLAVLRAPADSERPGTDLVTINVADFSDEGVPVYSMAGTTEKALVSALETEVTFNLPSPGGRVSSAFPMPDGSGRLLISWSQCRLLDGERIVPCAGQDPASLPEAPPLYGLWLLDPTAGAQYPVVAPVEGQLVTEAVVMNPFTTTPGNQRAETPFTTDLLAANAGAIHIGSLFDIDGEDQGIATFANPSLTPPLTRPLAFLRLIKPVSQPDDEVLDVAGTTFGRGRTMHEILGYATVHPDGSVLTMVPANVAFGLAVTDHEGRQLTPLHRHWLQVRPGEVLQCNGCHDPANPVGHGRRDAAPPSANPGQPFAGIRDSFPGSTGDTLALSYGIASGINRLDPDLTLADLWSPAPAAGSTLTYRDLQTPAPTSAACLDDWQSQCRITIHYPEHIQPLWDLPRQDAALTDRTCTSCHSPVDAMGLARLPAAQLDLRGEPSADEPDHLTSYRELVFRDNELELIDGVLSDRLEQVTDGNGELVFATDEEGELILDDAGEPIPVLTTVLVRPVVRGSLARDAWRFLRPFETGGSHEGDLTALELRLLIEWLDLGARYYNDPFAVPQ